MGGAAIWGCGANIGLAVILCSVPAHCYVRTINSRLHCAQAGRFCAGGASIAGGGGAVGGAGNALGFFCRGARLWTVRHADGAGPAASMASTGGGGGKAGGGVGSRCSGIS